MKVEIICGLAVAIDNRGTGSDLNVLGKVDISEIDTLRTFGRDKFDGTVLVRNLKEL